MKLRRAVIALVLIAIAVPLSGCSFARSESASAQEPAPRAPVASASAAVVGELPAGWPKSLPVWPGARVAGGDCPKGGPFTLTLETGDQRQDVVNGLVEGFEKASWTVTSSDDDSSTTSLEVSNDTLEGIVSVSSGQDANCIEYLLTPLGR
jgi:uncharacterized protein YceK